MPRYLATMNRQPRNDRPEKPWWYRLPVIPVGLIVYSVVGIVFFTAGASVAVSLGTGLAVALAAAFVRGMAAAAHDERHR